MKRKIDKLGRISLPVDFRRELNLNVGEEAEIELKGNKIVVSKPNGNKIDNLLEELYESVNDEQKCLVAELQEILL